MTPETLSEAIQRCAREPIHVPGSIQPHGFLLVVDATQPRVLQASANVADWLGVAAEQLLGQRLDELLNMPELGERLSRLGEHSRDPFHLGDVRFELPGSREQAFALLAHRNVQDQLILEFEPASSTDEAYGILYPLMRTFVARLHEARDIREICQRAVEELGRICNFGRIKAYRFDEEGNGEVLAELARPGYPRYLGHRFPASDIPQQARQLYIQNLIRVIPDCDYRPAPLVPMLNPASGEPLDLSFASLRSVSPVHLQYMRNMGTRASMSVSIVVRDQLWGLISCHDAEPQRVSHKTRATCELLARILSLQIDAHEAARRAERRLELRQLIVQLLSSMADRDSVSEGLRSLPETFLGFADAQGAAVIGADSCLRIGEAPDEATLQALAGWLSQHCSEPLFASDCLSRDLPELPALHERFAGLLAVSISRLHAHYLLWFRPEKERTITWAGRPEKTLNALSGALDPRSSFETWREVVRGQALPWDDNLLEGALELRNAVLGIVLRKAEELALLSDELRKSNQELEAFSYSVSHDLRAPLRHIAGYTELLNELEGRQLSERGQRFLGNIGDAARFAGTLVDNLLNFSQMGRSALHLSDVDLGAMVASILEEMRPDHEERDIEWQLQPMPRVVADAAFIHMVLRNLIGNAIKYSRDRAPARIEIGAQRDEGETVVYVRDNGVGFDMQYAPKLFGVFQRLHRMEEFEGTGIGLASVRRIIERHGGRVWAEGRLDEGATFYFALPNLDYSAARDNG